jgi:hypothetical protein
MYYTVRDEGRLECKIKSQHILYLQGYKSGLGDEETAHIALRVPLTPAG